MKNSVKKYKILIFLFFKFLSPNFAIAQNEDCNLLTDEIKNWNKKNEILKKQIDDNFNLKRRLAILYLILLSIPTIYGLYSGLNKFYKKIKNIILRNKLKKILTKTNYNITNLEKNNLLNYIKNLNYPDKVNLIKFIFEEEVLEDEFNSLQFIFEDEEVLKDAFNYLQNKILSNNFKKNEIIEIIKYVL